MSQPPLGVRLGYAAPGAVLAFVGIPVYVYLPKFYTDVVGAQVTWVGVFLVLIRLADGLTDPAIGTLSDRTRTRWGRRRVWILGGALPLSLALVLTLVPPELGPIPGALWFGATLALLYLAWTVVAVPYEALGLELCDDYDGRTSLLGWRDGAVILGTLAAAAAPEAVRALGGLGHSARDERAVFAQLAWVYAPSCPWPAGCACAWCASPRRARCARASPGARCCRTARSWSCS
ncbi:MAG: MFS transporter [Planctomycetota bacterium]